MSPSTFAHAPDPESTSRAGTWVAIVLLCLVVAAVGGFLANRTLRQIEGLNAQIDTLQETLRRTTEDADAATQRAVDAERSARISNASREQADDDAERALQQAVDAEQRAAAAEETSIEAQEEARLARERTEEVRRVAEAEMNRLTAALGRIAETRRTALGLVMSLDEGYLKFDFDEAELRPEGREVLSRIAGILFTADDFCHHRQRSYRRTRHRGIQPGTVRAPCPSGRGLSRWRWSVRRPLHGAGSGEITTARPGEQRGGTHQEPSGGAGNGQRTNHQQQPAGTHPARLAAHRRPAPDDRACRRGGRKNVRRTPATRPLPRRASPRCSRRSRQAPCRPLELCA